MGDLWDDGVAEAVDALAHQPSGTSVHPSGYPIIHSTNAGERRGRGPSSSGPNWDASIAGIVDGLPAVIRRACDGGSVSFRASFAVGVGISSRRILPRSVGEWPPLGLFWYVEPFASPVFGVGSSWRAITSSSLPLGFSRAVSGEPMPADARGVGSSASATARPGLFGFVRPSPDFLSVRSLDAFAALGVGSKEPDAVAPVRGVHTRSRNNERPDFVAECFQRRYDLVEPHRDVPSNILAHNEVRPALGNNAHKMTPERAVIRLAFALPGGAVGLARVACGDEVDESAKRSGVEGGDVIVLRSGRPMVSENAAAPLVSFDERRDVVGLTPHPPRCEGEPADAAE